MSTHTRLLSLRRVPLGRRVWLRTYRATVLVRRSFLGGSVKRLCAISRACRWTQRLWPQAARSLAANDGLLSTRPPVVAAEPTGDCAQLWALARRCAGLTAVDLSACRGLTQLSAPNGRISACPAVETLSLRGLLQLGDISLLSVCFPSLTALDVSSCRGLRLQLQNGPHPRALMCCQLLAHLSLSGLRNLDSLESLRAVDCEAEEDVSHNSGVENATSLLLRLRSLDAACCRSLTSICALATGGGAPKLRSLTLRKCRALLDLDGLQGCAGLTELSLNDCRQLSSSALSRLRSCGATLQSLSLATCQGLTEIEGLRCCAVLKRLDLGGCRSLRSVNALEDLRCHLCFLNLKGCEKLCDLGPLQGAQALTTLNIAFCSSVASLHAIRTCPALTWLDASFTKNVRDVGVLAQCARLVHVVLTGCMVDKDAIARLRRACPLASVIA